MAEETARQFLTELRTRWFDVCQAVAFNELIPRFPAYPEQVVQTRKEGVYFTTQNFIVFMLAAAPATVCNFAIRTQHDLFAFNKATSPVSVLWPTQLQPRGLWAAHLPKLLTLAGNAPPFLWVTPVTENPVFLAQYLEAPEVVRLARFADGEPAWLQGDFAWRVHGGQSVRVTQPPPPPPPRPPSLEEASPPRPLSLEEAAPPPPPPRPLSLEEVDARDKVGERSDASEEQSDSGEDISGDDNGASDSESEENQGWNLLGWFRRD